MTDGPIPTDLPDWPNITARDLLHCDVDHELAAYQERQNPAELLLLDVETLAEAVSQGQVAFGKRDLPAPEIDDTIARRAASEAVTDGVVLMFIDDAPVRDLDSTHRVTSESRVRYLRLHAQTGF